MKRRKIAITTDADLLLITVPDSIDMDSCRAVEESILPELDGLKRDVVLDFSGTTAIYSSGLGLVIRIKTRVNNQGRRLFLVNVSDKLREGFQSVGLDKVLDVFSNLGDLHNYRASDNSSAR